MQKMSYYIRIHLITDSITLAFILFIIAVFCAFEPMNRLTIELNEFGGKREHNGSFKCVQSRTPLTRTEIYF